MPSVPSAALGLLLLALPPAMRLRIDALFKPYDKPNVPGCALGVFRDGRLAYGRGYGWADLERAVPITTATLFDIGSTSKQFAAASIALLAEDHKLAFTDDVRQYIPELPDYGHVITIDNLMRHTSGLRDYAGLLDLAGHGLEEATTDSQALALIVRQRQLNFPTGSRYEYSNTGYFLLSVIVQRVSGQPLADFARDRIFRPLGMRHTRYRNRYAMLIPDRALGYAPQGTGAFVNSMSNWEQTGDGAVHLSVEDALKWDENFYHPRVGGQWMVDQLQARGTLANGDSIAYARGLFVHPYRGLRRVEHGGDWIGYHTAYARFPDQHTSIIVLCNSDGISPDELGDRVADIVLAKQFPTPPHHSPSRDHPTVASATPIAMSRLVGSYFEDTTSEVLRVVGKDSALILQASGRSFPLQRTGPSNFSVTGLPASVAFSVDGEGPAHALRLRVLDEDRPQAVRFTPAIPDTTALRAYAAAYHSDELDVTWTLILANNHLVLTGTRSDIAGPLDPAQPDAFTSPGGYLQFTRNAAGHVTGFDLSASRMRGIHFDRVH